MVYKPRTDDTLPPLIVGRPSKSGTTTATTVPLPVTPITVQTPVVQSDGPKLIIGRPSKPIPGSAEEFTANWSKLSPEEQAKRAPGALADLRLGANKQDQILSGLVSQAQAYKKALIASGSSEQEANDIVSGYGKPKQGFQKLLPKLKSISGAIVPDIARDVVKTVGGAVIPDVARDTVKAVGGALASPLGVPGRAFQGIIKEVQQELDVQFGATERGEETYAKLPGQFREKVGPFGLFRGAPVGLESLDVPKTPTGKAGFQWGEVLKVIKDEKSGVGTTNWQNMTGNIYVDQAVGFLGDVFGDPLNLLSAGAGGAAKTSVSKIAQYGPEAYQAAEAASDVLRAQGKLALKRELIKETIENSVKFPGLVPKATAEAAVAELKVVEQQLKVATKKVAGEKAPRLRGRNAAVSLASNLSEQVENLKAQLLRPDLSAEQAANIRLTLEYLTPQVIKDVAQKGMAGLIDATTGVLRTGNAADVLGVSNRLRIGGYLGKNQKIGFLKEIPFTTGIVQGSGKLISGTLGRGRGLATKALLGSIDELIPDGNGGFFPEGLASQRAALRAGTEGATQRNLELNKLNEVFRGRRVLIAKNAIAKLFKYGLTSRQAVPVGALKGNIRKALKSISPDAGYTVDDLQSILPLITDAGARATAKLSTQQQKALDAVRGFFKDLANEEQEISKLTGREIGIITDYFPQMLSDEALAMLRKNPNALNNVVRRTKFNALELKGNFLTRTLVDGEDFFGVTMTPEILKKGVTELNRIANAGGFKGKFFDDNVLSVVNKYVNRHADDMARQFTFAEAADIAPSVFARELVGPEAVVAAFDPKRVGTGFRKFVRALDRYPELSKDLELFADVLDGDLADLEVFLARGTYDLATVTALQDNALNSAVISLNLALGEIGAKSLFDITTKRFATSGDILNRGFIAIADAAPNVYASPEVLQLFQTVVKKSKNPAFMQALGRLASRELTILKAYQLASPRNVWQNTVGNLAMMVFAADAKLKFLAQGGDIYKAVEKGIRLGKSVDEIAAELAAKGIVKNAKEVVDAYAYVGSVGFGRYGEIAAEVGQVTKPGLRQGPAKGLPIVRNFDRGVTKKGSEIIGGVPKAVREVSAGVEQRQRFQFMWDGMQQGLTPQEAVARVQEYLFDYEDISKFDRFAKGFIPYYMWISRNMPKQLVNKVLKPRPYILLQKFKNATEQEDAGDPDSPNYDPVAPYTRQRGGYKSKDMEGFGKLIDNPLFKTVDPGLPFLGFGEESPSKYFSSPLQAFVGPLRPEIRLLVELPLNQIIGLGDAPIAKYNAEDPTGDKLEYAVRQLGFAAPLALAKRYIATIPPARQNETVQQILEIGADENQPGEQAIAALARVLGFVLAPAPLTNQKIGQIGGGIYDAKEILEEQQKKLKTDALREYEKRQTTP